MERRPPQEEAKTASLLRETRFSSSTRPSRVLWAARFALLLFALLYTAPGFATVDGGTEARLGGSFGEQRYAFIVETGIQEECFYGHCLAYLLDLAKDDFALLTPQKLESRNEVLKKLLCRGQPKKQCQIIVSKQLMVEEQDKTKHYERLAEQYLSMQSPERRAELGAFKPAPKRLPLAPQKELSSKLEVSAPQFAQTTPFEWLVSLEERWTVASFRAYTESGLPCRPDANNTCKQELRWIDGVRSDRWVCAGPCQGLASMVRVTARPLIGPSDLMRVGRSSLIEPGTIASYGVGMASTRRIPLSSLALPSHAVSAFAFPNRVVLVGAFAEGAGGNGTWFPLVLHLPRSLPNGTAASQPTANHSANSGSKTNQPPLAEASSPPEPTALPKQAAPTHPSHSPSPAPRSSRTESLCGTPTILGPRSTGAWWCILLATIASLRPRRRKSL